MKCLLIGLLLMGCGKCIKAHTVHVPQHQTTIFFMVGKVMMPIESTVEAYDYEVCDERAPR